MIVGTLLLNSINNPMIPKKYRGKIDTNQRIITSCDVCKKQHETVYREALKQRSIYGKDLCFGCKLKVQYAKGLRKSKGWDFLNKKGNYIKRYGVKKAKNIKALLSLKHSGKNNPMYGKNYQCYGAIQRAKDTKGKNFEEIYGNKKAKEIRAKLSKATSGKNNPMYGKPTPVGCGKGWKGWYKDYFFRSCLELSFIVNFLELNRLKYITAERDPFRIPYLDKIGTCRTYTADFVIGKKLIEIKPYEHLNKPINIIKKKAAVRWCSKNGYTYKIYTERDFKILTHEDMFKLCKKGFLELLKPYKKFLIKVHKEIYKK